MTGRRTSSSSKFTTQCHNTSSTFGIFETFGISRSLWQPDYRDKWTRRTPFITSSHAWKKQVSVFSHAHWYEHIELTAGHLDSSPANYNTLYTLIYQTFTNISDNALPLVCFFISYFPYISKNQLYLWFTITYKTGCIRSPWKHGMYMYM